MWGPGDRMEGGGDRPVLGSSPPTPAPAPLTAVLRRRAGPEPGIRRSRQRSARQATIAAIFAEGRGFGAGEGPPHEGRGQAAGRGLGRRGGVEIKGAWTLAEG